MAGGGAVVYRRGLPLLQQANLKDLKTSLNLRSLPILRGRGVAPFWATQHQERQVQEAGGKQLLEALDCNR